MTPRQLRQRIQALPPRQPIASDLTRRFWPQHRDRDERMHWIVWLHDHERRQTPAASRVYDRIQSAPMLLWLFDAANFPVNLITDAAIDAHGPWRPAHACSILRFHIPWSHVYLNLLERT